MLWTYPPSQSSRWRLKEHKGKEEDRYREVEIFRLRAYIFRKIYKVECQLCARSGLAGRRTPTLRLSIANIASIESAK